MRRLRHCVRWLLPPGVVLLAGIGCWRQFRAVSLQQMHSAWVATAPLAIAACLLGTAVSFACLAGYERFATRRVVPGRVPAKTALQVGAMSHAISNTLGFHALTGGALRYHLYRGMGLGGADVTRIVAATGLCVGAGVAAVSVVALLCVQMQSGGWRQSVLVGLALLLGGMLTLRRFPSAAWLGPRRSGGVLLLALLEMSAAIGALYVLLPAGIAPPPAEFTLVFVAAMLLGVASHSPGGIGVFEGAMLAALGRDGQASRVLVALMLYRMLYNLLPFVLASGALLVVELRRRQPGCVYGAVSLTGDTHA